MDLIASSRLRTRIAWVQGAETDLEEKRVHCQFISLRFFCHGYFHTKKYSHFRYQSREGFRKCACPSRWSLRCLCHVLNRLALGAAIAMVRLETNMSLGHWDCSPPTRTGETAVVQKSNFTAMRRSLNVQPRPEAAGKSEIERVLAGLSSEVGESSAYHPARCVVT